MTEIQGALGLSQLNKLNEFTRVRNDLADNYEDAFEQMDVRYQFVPSFTQSARHLFVIRILEEERGQVFQGLRDAGIGVNVHYSPVHLQPYYQMRGHSKGLCPEAELHGREAITLPLFPSLSRDQQRYVLDTLNRLLSESSQTT
jgi:dTDP-4-amino-4,6-dideoxygalactose transaminase